MITFFGAAGTVTGSQFLLEAGDRKILVDCGLFQGARELRDRNWREPGFDVRGVSAVLLTHAHIDHSGLLPRYYSLGLRCPVYCTVGTRELCEILLPDSGRLQEEEADYREKSGTSRHKPALPLYRESDARQVLKHFEAVEFGLEKTVARDIRVIFKKAGHILGAAFLEVYVDGRLITFSGDIGRYDRPIMSDPEPPSMGDVLLLESTYGGRSHDQRDPGQMLEEIINRTAGRQGALIIPSFAVGRAQLLLYYIWLLKNEKKIPDIPVVVDSPMALDATSIYKRHTSELSSELAGLLKNDRHPFSPAKVQFVRSRRESIELNKRSGPMIIISASGMLTGGRILHHLRHRIANPLNTILFVGFQPPGGRGDWIMSGAETLTLFKDEIPIRAEIESLSGFSAHGDSDELTRWVLSAGSKPERIALVHGEPLQARALKERLDKELTVSVEVPEDGSSLD